MPGRARSGSLRSSLRTGIKVVSDAGRAVLAGGCVYRRGGTGAATRQSSGDRLKKRPMRRILAQARKQLTQLVRDRMSLAMALVLPVMIMVLIGTSFKLTVSDLPIVVQDLDGSSASRNLIDAFRASVTLHVIAWPMNNRRSWPCSTARTPSSLFRSISVATSCGGQNAGPTAGGRLGLQHGQADVGLREPHRSGL